MTELLTLLIAGVSVGSIYGLVAIGLNLTFLTTRTLHFGQGSVMMFCAMLTTAIIAAGWPAWAAAASGIAAIALIMVITEAVAVRPALKREGSMGWAVATLGAGIVLQGVAALYFGSQAMAFPDILFSVTDNITLLGVRISMQYLAVLFLSILLAVGLELLMRRTIWGRAMRAVSMDNELAAVMGIPVRSIVVASYIGSGILAGIAGIMVAQIGGTVDPAFGFELMTFGFVAAVLGGMGSTMGVLVGGIIIGILQQFVGAYISSSMQHGIAFALLVLVLVVRPEGIFGQKEIIKV